MAVSSSTDRVARPLLLKVFRITLAIGFAKTFAAVLLPYRWYVPPDFERSVYLILHRDTFTGLFPVAFYVHIFVGPCALLIALAMMFRSYHQALRRLHRPLGRILALLVLLLLVPSGLVMAIYSQAGTLGSAGLAAGALATAVAMTSAVGYAMGQKMKQHREWAMRSFLMLCSPLVLRIFSGMLTVTQTDTITTYAIGTWLSWLVPLGVYQAVLSMRRSRRSVFVDLTPSHQVRT